LGQQEFPKRNKETRLADWHQHKPRENHETYMSLDDKLMSLEGEVCRRVCLCGIPVMRLATMSCHFLIAMAKRTYSHAQWNCHADES
jgi:hypothetical protein